MDRPGQTEKELEAGLLIEQALGEIDEIHAGKDQRYAEGSDKEYWKRRPMTMADAKPKAKRAAELLRQAWNLLDPSI